MKPKLLFFAVLLTLCGATIVLPQEETVTVIAIKANLRGTPDSRGAIVTIVEKNETFELIAKKGAWFLIQTPKYVGWIHGNAIEIDNYSSSPRTSSSSSYESYTTVKLPQKTTKRPTDGQSPFKAEYVGGYADPTITITNDADRKVTLIFGGVTYILESGQTKSITVEAGNYEYHASAPRAVPLSGVNTYEVGHIYTWRFYISR